MYQLLLLLSVVSAYQPDKIYQMPECEPFPSDSYSGYLNVSETKSLHYILVESQNNVTTDPVVLWFNGGPGCSSLLGYIQEHGPFVIDDNQTYIHSNPYSWNLNASVVYIESPAGVGYSWAQSRDDLFQNDISSSLDAYTALMEFYKKFPELKKNDLYISGESYGGIYVPYLAFQVYEHNMLGQVDSSIETLNLKGFIVGNGATDYAYDVSPSFTDTVYNFNLIPQSLYKTFKENNCFYSFNEVLSEAGDSKLCNETWDKINDLTAELNWYDLYRPVYPTTLSTRQGQTYVNGELKTYRLGMTMSEYTPWLKINNLKDWMNGDYVTEYLNREDVRQSLNIPDSLHGWEQCSYRLRYYPQTEGSIWIYRLLRNKMKILFYSGDTDGAVPTYGTRQWIQDLEWGIKEKWRPWFTNQQVSGYIEKYDGLDFITVHGVGHMAPQWKRQDVTNMITAWIHDQDI